MSEIKEDNDDIEIVETETIPAIPAEGADTQPAETKDDAIVDDDDDEEEARLGDNEDDARIEGESEEDYKKRRNRRTRQVRKQNRERARQELDFLRREVAELRAAQARTDGHTLDQTKSQIESRIAQATQEIQQAEFVLAKAIEAQNGEDVATALRLRDEATARRNKLTDEKETVEQAKTQHAQPKVDPRVVTLANQWIEANKEWFDPNGGNEDSRITKAIDAGLISEGYDPTSVDYYHELTRRVNARLGGEETKTPTRRTPPPQGKTREHAPNGTKNQVYVTPERKQAMIDAGIWDDVERRNKMLKAYQKYDRENSAS